jgi:hypothetical protein
MFSQRVLVLFQIKFCPYITNQRMENYGTRDPFNLC